MLKPARRGVEGNVCVCVCVSCLLPDCGDSIAAAMGVPDWRTNRSTSHRGLRGHGLARSSASLQLQTSAVVFLVLFAAIQANEYCSITCKGERHTMCLFPEGPGPACANYQPDPLSQAERDALLQKHNDLRNKMALGQVPPYPAASDMMEMTWDDELTRIAQRWADQCSFKHDKCRNSQRFNVGQNLALYFTNGPVFPEAESRVQAWYDEISLYPYSPGPFYFSTETGHFTQIVWSTTNRLGCARSRYVANNLPHQLLVCNYGPGGNVMGRPLYTAGEPCSQCSCSARYSGLCAVGTKLSTESPFSLAQFIPSYSPYLFSTTTNVPPPYFTNSVYSTNPPSLTAVETRTPTTTKRPSYFTTSKTTALLYPFYTTKRYATTVPPTTTYPTVYQTSTNQRTSSTRRLIPTTQTSPAPPTLLALGCPLPSTPGTACGSKRPAPLPLSSSDRAALLRLHNKWRAELARGGVAGFPSAADMKLMVWDNELADMAQKWADQCIWGHDPCRKTSRHVSKGQNIALSYGTNEAVEQRALEWFDEARHYKFTDAPYEFALNTSHFSQMAWADSYLLGCARARFPIVAAGSDANMLVCNYGPGGNVPGKKIYTPGAPCSKCGISASCSPVYSSLCAPAAAAAAAVTTKLHQTTPTVRPTTYTTSAYAPTTRSSRPQLSQRANELDVGLSPSAAYSLSLPPSVCPRPQGPGPACGLKYRASLLSPAEREALLAVHNDIRNRVASGLVKKLPAAANMNRLEWDDELAKLAQTWADQCTLGYDTCARTDFYHAGQNMAVWYSHDIENFPPPQERVTGWFNEIDNFNYINGLFSFNIATSALTQMLWASTRKLGCGRARFVTNGSAAAAAAAELLVCNYGPGGNVIGQKIYQSGTPCTQCDAGTKCSLNYSALCSR